MAIITVNTSIDSKEKIQKAIEELQAVIKQKEKFQNWKPASKQNKNPSASDILNEVKKMPITAVERREIENIKNRSKLETC